MPRAKKQPATDFNPAEFDPEMQPEAAAIVQQVAAATEMPPEHNGHAAEQAPASHAPGHIANPSSTRRESHADSVARRQSTLPDKLTVAAGDMKVQLIDKGDNSAGIGIRVALSEGRTLTAEEKDIIRAVMNEPNGQYPSGLRYNGVMWHKEIGANTPGYVASAIRADAERRVVKLADALKQHQVDPAGYADRIRQERENAPDGRIPD